MRRNHRCGTDDDVRGGRIEFVDYATRPDDVNLHLEVDAQGQIYPVSSGKPIIRNDPHGAAAARRHSCRFGMIHLMRTIVLGCIYACYNYAIVLLKHLVDGGGTRSLVMRRAARRGDDRGDQPLRVSSRHAGAVGLRLADWPGNGSRSAPAKRSPVAYFACTGAKLLRWIAHGPSRSSASKCSGVE